MRSGLRVGTGLLLLALGLAPSAQAQTRVDLFDKKSNRTGSATIDERTGRIDFFDTKSKRTGYGQVDPRSGRLDRYDLKGNRVGSGVIMSGGTVRER